MKKTIKVKAETLETARVKFEKELPQGAFILKKNEYDTFDSETAYFTGESVDDAIEKIKKELPIPFNIKGDLIPEIENGTNIYIPVKVQADSELSAELQVKIYIEDEYFRYKNFGFGVAKHYYSIKSIQLNKKGFNGVFGVGKTENSYQVNVYINANVRIKYKTWAVVEAEITDEINIANKRLFKYAKDGAPSEVENLVLQGVDVNYCDADGRNALFYLCSNYKISQLLIDKGIDSLKSDNSGDNILTYCLRNNCHAAYKIREFLEKNGIKEDPNLIKEIRQTKLREEGYSKTWCSKCNKKVHTVENGKYYDDGWMKDVDIICEVCGKVLEHYRGQV